MLCWGVLIARSFAVKCVECEAVSDTYEPYLDVVLDIGVQRQGRGGEELCSRGGCSCSCTGAALKAP